SQVARRRSPRAYPRRQALQVGGFGQGVAQLHSQAVLVEQFADSVETVLDGLALRQRRDDPLLKEARSHRRDGTVAVRQKRPGSFAAAQRPRQLQAAARHFVEEEEAILAKRPQPRQVAEARFEGFLHVEEQGPGGDEAGLLIVEAKAGKSADAEVMEQRGAGG